MAYLIDTNVLSELRKGDRCNRGVARWFAAVADTELFLSVLVVGELQRGSERIRRRDTAAAASLERWIEDLVAAFGPRILAVDLTVARIWGGFGVPDPVPSVDGLLAATAQHHGLILVTRNTIDVAPTGVETLNPFG